MPATQAAAMSPPRTVRPAVMLSGSKVARSSADAGKIAASVAIVATVVIRASRVARIRMPSTASWATHDAGATAGWQSAENLPHPLISPANQPMPSAMGAQPMTARPIRAPTPGFRSSSQWRIPSSTASVEMPSSASGDLAAADGPPPGGGAGGRRPAVDASRGDVPALAGAGPAGCASPVGAAPLAHQEVAVWMGPSARDAPGLGLVASGSLGSGPAVGASLGASVGSSASAASVSDGAASMVLRRRSARRARAWYSGPCLRGSAYSFGLSVQYVPELVPYHEAPPQS